MAGRPTDRIARVEGVSRYAVRLGRILRGRGLTAVNIHLRSNWLQVGRIHAAPVSTLGAARTLSISVVAKMVELEAVRDRANQHFPEQPVGHTTGRSTAPTGRDAHRQHAVSVE